MQKRDKTGKIIRKPFKSLINEPIIDKCKECTLHENSFCKVYVFPKSSWTPGNCPMATHMVKRVKESKFKRRIGQQKHKKGGTA